jgi:plastocyanin
MTRLFIVVAALAASASMASAQAAAQAVTVTLSEWAVVSTRDTVQAGPVTFRVSNTGTMSHSLYVIGEGVDKGTRDIPAKQTASLTVTLKPGTYELFCPMSEESHKNAGMKKTLVVKAGAAPEVPRKPDN